MKKYDVILFDLDGTVLDTLADLVNSVNHVLAEFGYPLRSTEEIRSFLGNGIRKLMERALPGAVESERFEEILNCFREYYTAHCEEETKPYSGITSMIEKMKAEGITVGLVSNKNDGAVQALVKSFFPGIFDVVVGQQEPITPKPASDMVDFALKILGLPNERCLYVGDSEVDRMTAQNAGMDCALVTWGFRDPEFLAVLDAKVLISQPNELISFVGL